MSVNKVGDPNAQKRTPRTFLRRRHRSDRAGEGIASVETDALVTCSLRIIAKVLDRPPESIAARWGAVALQGEPVASRELRCGVENAGEP